MNPDQVLVTGITGQVGSQLADYILENTSLDVVGMMRWQEPIDNIAHLSERINKSERMMIFFLLFSSSVDSHLLLTFSIDERL